MTLMIWVTRLNTYYALYALLLPLSLIPATWNVDLVHDASVMVPAGALVHGKILYSDLYSIFGPLMSWISFPFLNQFGVYLIVSRVLGALLFWATGLLFFTLLKRYFNQSFSMLVAGTWLISSSGFTTLNSSNAKLLFYSTNLGVLLLLLSFLVLSSETNYLTSLTLRLFIVSFLMAICFTVRIEFVLSWVLVLLSLLVFHGNRQVLLAWLFGGLICVIAYILQLLSSGVLSKFIASNIYYTKILASINSPLKLAENLFTTFWPIILWVFSSFIFFVMAHFLNHFKFTITIVLSVITALVMLLAHNLIEQNLDKSYRGISFYRWMDDIVESIPLSYSAFMLLAFPILLVIRLITIKYRIKDFYGEKSFSPSMVYVPVAISIYFYLHNMNLAYVHAFVPILSMGLIGICKTELFSNASLLKFLSKGMHFIIVLSVVILVNNLNVDRYSYNTKFLKGMSDVSKDRAIDIDSKFLLVRDEFYREQYYTFNCDEWLLTVNESSYYPERHYDTLGNFNESWCGLRLDSR